MDGVEQFLDWLGRQVEAQPGSLEGFRDLRHNGESIELRFRFTDGAVFVVRPEQETLSRHLSMLADKIDIYERTRMRKPENMIAIYSEFATLAEAAGLDFQAEEARGRAEELRNGRQLTAEAAALGIPLDQWIAVNRQSRQDAASALLVALAGRMLYRAGPEEIPEIRRRAVDPIYSTPITDPDAVRAIRQRIKDQGWPVAAPAGPAILNRTPLEIAARLARRLRARGDAQAAEQALEVVMWGVRYAAESHAERERLAHKLAQPADPVPATPEETALYWRRVAVRNLAAAGGAPDAILHRIAHATEEELDRIMNQYPAAAANLREAIGTEAPRRAPVSEIAPEIAYSADGRPPFDLMHPATGLPRAFTPPTDPAEIARLEEAIRQQTAAEAPEAPDPDGDCLDPLTSQLYRDGVPINPTLWMAHGLVFPPEAAANAAAAAASADLLRDIAEEDPANAAARRQLNRDRKIAHGGA
jgi:hypothetical protein